MPFRALTLAGMSMLLATAGATPTAKAVLKDPQGNEVGAVALESAKKGLHVAVEVTGLPPGKHGFHIHAVGKCEPPDFKTAGGHFNPGNKKHGLENPEGAHAGDLPNLVVDADGKGKLSYTDPNVSLGEGPNSLLGPEGAAFVIHADDDDEKTDPAGNSGARIACGVVEKS